VGRWRLEMERGYHGVKEMDMMMGVMELKIKK